ncbi:MORN motif protein (macronuclear) [Tetrahymena thermophila SB210]|uniref:MORN motif protein n=1 Tax=Tetrahymena thermophila (strain SB210) TaxID=312017 RepID=I7M7K9_TETTS|nr:MORN motif protein [Tetrahymena thermophila SB210]EAR94144.1 MORN motif protein [Tetrahymena thermophila SB210]|eukprot:XP_001014389.1 MORN motif protein [Tetrahymena thermophila SB210]
MIDLSLSQVDFEDQKLSNLICQYHKRKVTAFCIQQDCHQNDRFACFQCLSSREHSNHQFIDSEDVVSILKQGLPSFKNQIIQNFEQLSKSIVSLFQNKVKNFINQKADTFAQRFERCFSLNISERDQKLSEQLLELYKLIYKQNGNYLLDICQSMGQTLYSSIQKQLETIMKKINDYEFDKELQRFEIENQVIHNLTKEALEAYQKYKNENIFDDLNKENNNDSRLYLVNDRDFYTVSQFNIEGQRHGRTIEIPSQGHYFKGYLSNGLRNGKGLYIYQDGTVYLGIFKNNQKDGSGKLINRDGYIYSGEWKEDQKNGVGEEKFNDDWVFEGFFENNQRNGPGQETNKKLGLVIQAIYEKGEIVNTISQLQIQQQLQQPQ